MKKVIVTFSRAAPLREDASLLDFHAAFRHLCRLLRHHACKIDGAPCLSRLLLTPVASVDVAFGDYSLSCILFLQRFAGVLGTELDAELRRAELYATVATSHPEVGAIVIAGPVAVRRGHLVVKPCLKHIDLRGETLASESLLPRMRELLDFAAEANEALQHAAERLATEQDAPHAALSLIPAELQAMRRGEEEAFCSKQRRFCEVRPRMACMWHVWMCCLRQWHHVQEPPPEIHHEGATFASRSVSSKEQHPFVACDLQRMLDRAERAVLAAPLGRWRKYADALALLPFATPAAQELLLREDGVLAAIDLREHGAFFVLDFLDRMERWERKRCRAEELYRPCQLDLCVLKKRCIGVVV